MANATAPPQKPPQVTGLGEVMITARLTNKRTREEVAIEIGTSLNAIVQWELGNHNPGLKNLIRYARATGTKASTLLRKVGE